MISAYARNTNYAVYPNRIIICLQKCLEVKESDEKISIICSITCMEVDQSGYDGCTVGVGTSC
jgi:hypothetical protein